jgi:hypothetical protein
VSQRTDAQQTQEVELNDHPTNRREVPGLLVTIYEDNIVPSRTLAYFAGVEAEAYFGIHLLDEGDGFGGPGGPGGPGGNGTGATGPGQAGAPGTSGPGSALSQLPTVAPTGGVLGGVRHGLQVLANSLSRTLRLFGVWAILLVPVYLSARRWMLLSRGSLPRGTR